MSTNTSITEFTEEVWELTRQLVRIDSTDPGAYEEEIGLWIYHWLEEKIRIDAPSMGKCIQLERKEVLPGRYNVRARIPSLHEISNPKPIPGLIYICHMDTVVFGDDWNEDTPPTGAVVQENRLYGRGACDMKSGLACALYAFREMLQEIETKKQLPEIPFSFIGTIDEEDFMRGSEAAISDHWVSKEDFVLDTEPTDGEIQVAHKGRLWFEVSVTGITAHASTPWKGADAVAAMAEIIHEIRTAIAACPDHPELGFSTVTFGQIEGGYRPYVVPDRSKLWIDMRLVPPTTTEVATAIVEKAITQAEKVIPGIHGSYIITGDRPYVEKDDHSQLLAELLTATEMVTGSPAVVGTFNGYTDTAVIAGTLKNHNCMSYGPGSLELAHKPNEYVPREDVDRAAQVLRRLAQNMLWK